MNRGSGIGASWTNSNLWGAAKSGQGGGRGASAATDAMQYSGPGFAPTGVASSLKGSPGWLLILVIAEAAGLVALRQGFRHHHGG